VSRPRQYASAAERKRAYRRRRGIPARFRPVDNAPIEGEKNTSSTPADRQRAYRDRKRGFESHRTKVVLPVPDTQNCTRCAEKRKCGRCSHAWNKYLCSVGLPAPNNKNFYMKDAPQGCGRLATGGNDAEKLDVTDAAHILKESGRKTKAVGDRTYSVSSDKAKSADATDAHEQTEWGTPSTEEPTPPPKIPTTPWTPKYKKVVANFEVERLEAQLRELEVLPPTEIARREQEFGFKPGEYLDGYRKQLRKQQAKAGV
jgi:hypothetical protein